MNEELNFEATELMEPAIEVINDCEVTAGPSIGTKVAVGATVVGLAGAAGYGIYKLVGKLSPKVAAKREARKAARRQKKLAKMQKDLEDLGYTVIVPMPDLEVPKNDESSEFTEE